MPASVTARRLVTARRPAAAEPSWGTAALSRAAPAQQQPRAAPSPPPQPAPSGMAAAVSAALPTAFNEANSSKAMESRAASAPALSMLKLFIWGQCTAWHSSSARPTCIRVSMGSWASMSLPWRVLACYRESCATNDERREPAPGAVAWVAIGDSCGAVAWVAIGDSYGRPGGFFCVPCVRAGTRVEAGAPMGIRGARPTGNK